MANRSELKRVNVYVNPDDLQRVAEDLGCRPSDAVRQLISNYLLATKLDEIRRLPGGPALDVFHPPERSRLPEIPEEAEIEPVE